MGKDVEFETPAFDLAEELQNGSKQSTSASIKMDASEEMAIDFGMNEEDLLPNDDPEFEESEFDLSSVISPDEEDLEEALDEQLNETQVPDALVAYLSSNPNVVKSLNKGVTNAHLDGIGSSINADLISMYESNENINMMVNAIAQGMLVSDRFENTVANTVKMYYVPASKNDSIHLHTSAGGFQTYRSTPAVKAFDANSINKLSALYRNQIMGFDTLFSYVKDACYKPVASQEESAQKESQAYHAMDNLDLAKGLHKATISIDEGAKRLESIGFSKERVGKIAVLAKALKDNS